MDHYRVDSGFDGSYCSNLSEPGRPLLLRSNTAPTRRRKPRKISSEPSPNSQSPDIENQRPASEKRLSGLRRSGEPRRISIGSSSERSTIRSRRQGGGSKPSSRRTSCTLVDPSRPTRHYRIKSSQTVPSTNRDVDDVLALHFRSCSLFQNPTYRSGHHLHGSISGYEIADVGTFSSRAVPVSAPAPQSSVDAITTSESPKQSEETIEAVELPSTTMHWTSPSTRKREYEKIDRANSGIRGLVRRMLPRCVSGPPPPRFYEKDMSDVGSVRRYRMDITETDHDEAEQKNMALLRHQQWMVEKKPSTETTSPKPKWWTCF
ncbi:uncharacterized protein BDR25DRAFT_4278 [Lindgomyces ingoldianus]|uniref:Uncharacterized protein n=1 Tax=Lindgomyces ingoldianus TaxID=673940 RepID=A0ACB6RH82_9PLEO|nr:uncharacterized protein BDR25DRAFT_4278 [Lindgomyces ingoldianus]KAF2477831.1 hypothetical protein BDR25DRAFT_4278 [Lindgomyces ingoldianus]